jgi:hypothetical protein
MHRPPEHPIGHANLLTRRSRAARRLVGALVIAALASAPVAALAQERTVRFPTVGSLGDVSVSDTPNTGMLHVIGGLRIDTADYFRGAFDDVPERLDEIVIGPDLAVTFELWRDRPGFLRDLSLTLGTQNGLADQVQPTDSLNEWWYESNNFVGLAARLPADWVVGLTYTIYTSPNDVSPTFQEAALAARYTGRIFGLALNPQIKVAVPLDRQDAPFQTGVYTELAVTPSVKPFGDLVSLSFPLAVGAGFDGYYGPGDDASVYGTGGVNVSLPLGFVPAGYGRWALTVGGHVLVRDDDIRRLSAFDGDDNVILFGKVALGFTY